MSLFEGSDLILREMVYHWVSWTKWKPMGIILKKRSHIYSRIPGGILIILFLSISPLIIGFIGASISEWYTGNPCHEGNCIWGVLGWLTFWTVPLGAFVFIVFVVIVFADLYQLKK